MGWLQGEVPEVYCHCSLAFGCLEFTRFPLHFLETGRVTWPIYNYQGNPQAGTSGDLGNFIQELGLALAPAVTVSIGRHLRPWPGDRRERWQTEDPGDLKKQDNWKGYCQARMWALSCQCPKSPKSLKP